MKVISDELYEMMWEIYPTAENLALLKERLAACVDTAWEEYNQEQRKATKQKDKIR